MRSSQRDRTSKGSLCKAFDAVRVERSRKAEDWKEDQGVFTHSFFLALHAFSSQL